MMRNTEYTTMNSFCILYFNLDFIFFCYCLFFALSFLTFILRFLKWIENEGVEACFCTCFSCSLLLLQYRGAFLLLLIRLTFLTLSYFFKFFFLCQAQFDCFQFKFSLFFGLPALEHPLSCCCHEIYIFSSSWLHWSPPPHWMKVHKFVMQYSCGFL